MIELDRYVVDTLLPDLVGHDHHPSAFLVYLGLIGAAGTGWVALSYGQIAERTGLSKRAAQMAVARLRRRGLIEINGQNTTEPLRYRVLTPWRPARR